jgi:hypothetical protein
MFSFSAKGSFLHSPPERQRINWRDIQKLPNVPFGSAPDYEALKPVFDMLKSAAFDGEELEMQPGRNLEMAFMCF